MNINRLLSGWLLLLSVVSLQGIRAEEVRRGKFEIQVHDEETGRSLAARMHLKNVRGRTIHPQNTKFWKDHFVFDGAINLELVPGNYTFELECGPEYRIREGEFLIRSGATDRRDIKMSRFVNMKKEGWWSGELHVHRPLEDIPLLIKAEDLHVAPVITWWNKRNRWADKAIPQPLLNDAGNRRFYRAMAGEDERGGGALLFFNLQKPLAIADAAREFPCSVRYLHMAAADTAAHIDIEKPFWWDVPLWLATGEVDSIGIAHNHMWRDGVLDNEAWGRARDPQRFAGHKGNGRWTQQIYYHILNCGLRIPPSAGSASGVLPNPVGYNRAYVHCGEELTYDQWFRNLRAGKVVVTNGPMMRPMVNGQLPGHVFYGQAGETLELQVTMKLSLRERVDYLEVVKDGKVALSIRLDEYKEKRGKLPKIPFTESGWMMIRAVTDSPKTYRFAASGPFYVDFGGASKISKTSAQFFLDWLDQRSKNLELADPAQRHEVLMEHAHAREFWVDLIERANAD